MNRLEAAARDLDLVRFHEADLAFHKLVWEVPQNETQRHAGASVLQAFCLPEDAARDPTEYNAAVEQHRQIFEGLRSGEPAAALEFFMRSTLKF